MFYSIVLELETKEDLYLPPFNGHFVYSAFLSLISEYKKKLADKLHTENTVKLFTLSTLLGDFKYENKSILLKKENKYSIRITILDKYDFAEILDLFLNKKINKIKIGAGDFNIVKIATTPLEHKYASFVTLEDLWQKSSNKNTMIGLKFLSPTTFRASGKNKFIPFPDLVFNSIKRKFDLVCKDFKTFEIDHNDLRIARFNNLSTKVIELKQSKHICFVGEVYYEILNKEKIKYINALSNFVKYSGVGAKTTMGAGQTIKTL